MIKKALKTLGLVSILGLVLLLNTASTTKNVDYDVLEIVGVEYSKPVGKEWRMTLFYNQDEVRYFNPPKENKIDRFDDGYKIRKASNLFKLVKNLNRDEWQLVKSKVIPRTENSITFYLAFVKKKDAYLRISR